MIQRKSKMMLILLCCVILYSGCEEIQKEDNIQETKEIAVNSPEESVPASSPLIYADNPQEENMADLLQDAAAGVMVQVRVGDAVGSGVIWSRVGDMLTIATAAHVFTVGNGVAEVTFADGWTSKLAGYEITDTDLAFLFVSLSGVPQEQLEQYYVVNVEENGKEPDIDDGIILMGSVTGVAEQAYEGKVLEPWMYVEALDQYMIVVKAEAEEGMSGGGLFDLEGHFLGILCGKSGDGEAVVLPRTVIASLYGAI